MKRKPVVPFTLVVCLSLLLIAAGLARTTPAVADVSPNTITTRANDLVRMTGSFFQQFVNININELVLYRYTGSAWEPIPSQIDERDITGKYTISEGGLLDANDELAFMAFDLGENVTEDNWVNDSAARSNWRYRIRVVDDLDPTQDGYVYLYRSNTLPRAAASYVHWDEPSETFTGLNYVASLNQAQLTGVADIKVNNVDVDILDRQKVRVVQRSCQGSSCQDDDINEENLSSFITIPPLNVIINGPVRAIADGPNLTFIATGTNLDTNLNVNLSTFDVGGVNVNFLNFRYSFDFNDPVVTGWGPATYYSPVKQNGAPIDGVMDNVPVGPLVTWYEHIGSWGGLVTILSMTPTSGVQNYYKDNSAFDSLDTGDHKAFAETGIYMPDPESQVNIRTGFYPIPAGVGNVGQAYWERFDTPLGFTAIGQRLGLNVHIYLPVAPKN